MGLDRSARPNNPPSVPLILLSQKVAVSTPVESVFVEIHISLGAEMNHRRTDDSESRFAGYVEGLASVIGHKDREEPLRQAGSPAQAGALEDVIGARFSTRSRLRIRFWRAINQSINNPTFTRR